MKLTDHKMLEEAYSKISEDYFPQRSEPKYVDMEDGSTKLDLYNTFDKTALFSYIMSKPQLNAAIKELVDKRDTQTFYKWLASLDKQVLSNGDQQAYVQDAFRDAVHSKYPQAKKDYEELQRKANERATPNKPTISSLAKEDPREVEGYGRTFGEAHDINMPNLKGKEWHGLGAKMPKGPSMGDLIKPTFQKKMQDVNLGGGMKKSMPEYSLSNELIDALDNYGGDVSYKELAKAVADLIKDQYGSHVKMDFLTALNRELSTSKE